MTTGHVNVILTRAALAMYLLLGRLA